MFYFIRKELQLEDTVDTSTLRSRLGDKFEVISEGEDFKLIRKRILGNRGILRLLFPKLLTKVSLAQNILTYKIKFDGLALFMLFMVAGAIMVEFTMDREMYPREYPIWVPLGIGSWYIISSIIEFIRVDKDLKKVLAHQ